MHQKLSTKTGYNRNDIILVTYQHGGMVSISTGNLIGHRTESDSDLEGLGRWTWKNSGDKARQHSNFKTVTGLTLQPL